LALEHKDGRSYYYRSVRQGELVRKKYVGAGVIAALAAETDRIARARCEAQALKENQEREHIERALAFVGELEEATKILTEAHLIVAGYHQHKGEWRRLREST
jgi:hypothetical protein